jgi:hypothetical protein
MNSARLNKLQEQCHALLGEVLTHPHRRELLALMQAQCIDDAEFVSVGNRQGGPGRHSR